MSTAVSYIREIKSLGIPVHRAAATPRGTAAFYTILSCKIAWPSTTNHHGGPAFNTTGNLANAIKGLATSDDVKPGYFRNWHTRLAAELKRCAPRHCSPIRGNPEQPKTRLVRAGMVSRLFKYNTRDSNNNDSKSTGPHDTHKNKDYSKIKGRIQRRTRAEVAFCTQRRLHLTSTRSVTRRRTTSGTHITLPLLY